MEKVNVLPNGIRVVFGKKTENTDLVRVILGCSFGSNAETEKTQGVCAVWIKSLKRIAKKSGVTLYEHKGGDVTIFELEVPAKELDVAMNVVASMLIEPRFPASILRGAVEDVLQDVRDNAPLLDKQMSLALKKAAFRNVLWLPEKYCASVLENGNIAAQSEFVRKNVVGSNLVIGVEGDYVDAEKLLETIEALFVEMPKGNSVSKGLQPYVGGFVKIPHIGANRVKIGFPLGGVRNFPAAHVLLEVLKSWLIRRFNDYDPEAQFDLRVAHNMGNRILEMTAISRLPVNKLLDVFFYEFNRLVNEGPSDRRLERSINRAMGERLGKRQRPEALLDAMIICLRQGKPINYDNSIMKMSNVLAYDVKDCAKTIFVDNPPTVVIATQETDNEHMNYEQIKALIKVDD